MIEMLRARTVVTMPGGMPLIDARDLAAAIAASLVPGRGPRRYMAGGTFLSSEELAQLFEQVTGHRFARLPLPGAAIRLLGRIGDLAQSLGWQPMLTSEAANTATRGVPSDDSAIGLELGVEKRDARETLRDTFAWLVETGRLSRREAGRSAPAAARRRPGRRGSGDPN